MPRLAPRIFTALPQIYIFHIYTRPKFTQSQIYTGPKFTQILNLSLCKSGFCVNVGFVNLGLV